MPNRTPSDATLVDVVAYYNAATASSVSQGLERDRLLAAVKALREEKFSVRDIAAILGTSYGTVTRAMTYRLPPAHMMAHWIPSPYATSLLPDWLYSRTFHDLARATWRHSRDAYHAFPADLRDGEFSAAEYAREQNATFTCEPKRELSVFADVAPTDCYMGSPLPVIAQGIAHKLGCKIDGGGRLYDQHEVWLARDLDQLAAALTNLGWVGSKGQVQWSSFLDGRKVRDGAVDEVRQAASRL